MTQPRKVELQLQLNPPTQVEIVSILNQTNLRVVEWTTLGCIVEVKNMEDLRTIRGLDWIKYIVYATPAEVKAFLAKNGGRVISNND